MFCTPACLSWALGAHHVSRIHAERKFTPNFVSDLGFQAPAETILLDVKPLLFLLRDLTRKLQRGLHPPKSTPWGNPNQASVFSVFLAGACLGAPVSAISPAWQYFDSYIGPVTFVMPFYIM